MDSSIELGLIQVAIRTDESTSRVFKQENSEDKYVLLAPLCRGNYKREFNKQVIFDGEFRPGMLRLLAPGESVTVTKRSRLEEIVIEIPGARFRQLFSNGKVLSGSSRTCLMEPITSPSLQVEGLCRSFLSASDLTDQHRQLFVDGLAYSLLAILLSAQQKKPESALHFCKGRLTDAELMRCLDFADSRLAERLDLGDWANVLGMSTSEFARRFQQKTGVAPYAWFMNWRIDRAKQLLRQPNLSVVEVALEVGFCSQSHFTEAFRRRVGLSPGRWRAQHRAAGF